MKTIDDMGRHGSQAPSATRRDGWIIGQALYWFIREQQKLPKEQFEWSNTEDAKLILLTWFSDIAEHFAQNDQCVGCKPANLELEKYDQTMPHLLMASTLAGRFPSRDQLQNVVPFRR